MFHEERLEVAPARQRAFAGLVLAALAFHGCSTPPEAAPPATVPGDQNLVEIDPSAVKEGRVRCEAARIAPLPQVLQVTGRIGVDENRTSRVGSIVEGRAPHRSPVSQMIPF